MKMRWQVLTDLIKQYEFTKGAEIGVAYGKNLFNLLDANLELSMIAVDQWKPVDNVSDKGPKGLYGYPKMPHTENEKTVMSKADKYGKRLLIMKMDSVDAANKIKDGALDFVFIDACHAEQETARDIKAWAPKVRKGGLILGHDIHYPSVEAAVLKTLGEYKVYSDYCWCCHA